MQHALRPLSSVGVDLRLDPDDTERSQAFAPTAIEAARVLAELAIERAARGDAQIARQSVEDATVLLDAADEPVARARISLSLGEALLLLHEAHRAKARFAQALHVLEAEEDLAGSARALLGLGRALHMLGDAAARNAFEDAGLLYEDLGDEATVRAIDRELRALEAEIEESPRSFSSHHRIALRSPE